MKRPAGSLGNGTDSAPADTRLLAIAADQLKEFGPKHITVVGIADAAGMTHANVYRYFTNKAALIDAVAGQWLREMEATIADIADSPDPADDKLERLIQAWARVHRDLLKEDRHLFDVYCTATETSRPLVRKHRARMRQLIERVLDEGIVTGKFDPRDREKAHAFISDAVYRFINPLTVRLDAEVPQDILDQRLATMIRVVLRALANGSV
ncbi:TetR/AcrR family transcriptional regulator [Microvirga sp. CF3062]|uniref:TetR/AcrR family transcriptional regulator n=1 Tax=Microvirga sp. CF3062 TaxID=3110182 RepID=UPI002E79BA23|nr:TetR/AcrR family transcriptional regulator [Microvirga sp. CF3062]MEE1656772.1 TetR/AcrR family transcriptional regulator [Microvirga sp. CF3062]